MNTDPAETALIDPTLQSWVTSANDPASDFPLQNLPFGRFRRTALEPWQLLDALQGIEQEQGRVRKAERWGPRTLDLDILLFGERLIDDERLTVPHYHMHARPFVLYPLAELVAELQLPDGRSLAALLQACPFSGLERLPE